MFVDLFDTIFPTNTHRGTFFMNTKDGRNRGMPTPARFVLRWLLEHNMAELLRPRIVHVFEGRRNPDPIICKSIRHAIKYEDNSLEDKTQFM